jgi:hypothetical protein
MSLNKNTSNQIAVSSISASGLCVCLCVCLIFTPKRAEDGLAASYAVRDS